MVWMAENSSESSINYKEENIILMQDEADSGLGNNISLAILTDINERIKMLCLYNSWKKRKYQLFQELLYLKAN